MLEIAKSNGLATGVVTTTRITHATPAATYAHICHRDGENNIAAQMVPGGPGYNGALLDGVDVVFGGGLRHFQPKTAGGSRTDARDLAAEMKAAKYQFAASGKLLGLFTSSHMAYDLDRDAVKEPRIAEMAARAIDKMQAIDPGLKNTLIVVTADHDHTLVLNGYAARTGKTSDANPGVLGLLRNYVDGNLRLDTGGNPFTIIGFGNGENRPAVRTALTDAQVFAKDYHEEAAIPTVAGGETHGGADVFLGAIGKGANAFHGVIDNTAVFDMVLKAAGL